MALLSRVFAATTWNLVSRYHSFTLRFTVFLLTMIKIYMGFEVLNVSFALKLYQAISSVRGNKPIQGGLTFCLGGKQTIQKTFAWIKIFVFFVKWINLFQLFLVVRILFFDRHFKLMCLTILTSSPPNVRHKSTSCAVLSPGARTESSSTTGIITLFDIWSLMVKVIIDYEGNERTRCCSTTTNNHNNDF